MATDIKLISTLLGAARLISHRCLSEFACYLGWGKWFSSLRVHKGHAWSASTHIILVIFYFQICNCGHTVRMISSPSCSLSRHASVPSTCSGSWRQIFRMMMGRTQRCHSSVHWATSSSWNPSWPIHCLSITQPSVGHMVRPRWIQLYTELNSHRRHHKQRISFCRSQISPNVTKYWQQEPSTFAWSSSKYPSEKRVNLSSSIYHNVPVFRQKSKHSVYCGSQAC